MYSIDDIYELIKKYFLHNCFLDCPIESECKTLKQWNGVYEKNLKAFIEKELKK